MLFSVFSVFVVSLLDELPVPLLLGLPMLPLLVSLLPVLPLVLPVLPLVLPVLPLLVSELLPVPLEPIVSDEPVLALFGAFFAFFLCFLVVFVVVEVSLELPAEPALGLALPAEPALPWANAGAEDSRNSDATITLSLRMSGSLLPRRVKSRIVEKR